MAGDAAVLHERVVAADPHVDEVGVLSHHDIRLCGAVRYPAGVFVGNGLGPGVVVPQAPPRVVAGHADRPPADAVGREPGDQRRRVAADPHRGIRADAGRRPVRVRVVAGGAGLGVDLVRGPRGGALVVIRAGQTVVGPAHAETRPGVVAVEDVVERVPRLFAGQHREPGEEAVPRVAARAAAVLALVDGQLVVGVRAQLPLLEASVAERLPVADAADVGGDADPRVGSSTSPWASPFCGP